MDKRNSNAPYSHNIKLVITMGLPGSGKTHYANNYVPKANDRVFVIHCDDKPETIKSFSEYVRGKYAETVSYVGYSGHTNNVVILDGLFLTKSDVENVIRESIEAFKKPFECSDYSFVDRILCNIASVKIVWFNENRPACLNNDKYRRNLSSEAIIKNAPYENFNNQDLEALKANVGIKDISLTKLVTGKYSTWDIEFAPVESSRDKGFLKSDTWVTGGHYGNYKGEYGELTPENAKDFTEFDDLMTNICPEVSFLKYKKLKNECCSIEETSEYGYYGSYTYYNGWVCDLRKLYNMMLEMGLINKYPENGIQQNVCF